MPQIVYLNELLLIVKSLKPGPVAMGYGNQVVFLFVVVWPHGGDARSRLQQVQRLADQEDGAEMKPLPWHWLPWIQRY